MAQQFRAAFIGDIVNAKSSVLIATLQHGIQFAESRRIDTKVLRDIFISYCAPEGVAQMLASRREIGALTQEMAIVLLDISEHQIPDNPNLVGM